MLRALSALFFFSVYTQSPVCGEVKPSSHTHKKRAKELRAAEATATSFTTFSFFVSVVRTPQWISRSPVPGTELHLFAITWFKQFPKVEVLAHLMLESEAGVQVDTCCFVVPDGWIYHMFLFQIVT